MAIRSTVGSMLESAIGRERTNNLRQAGTSNSQRARYADRHGAGEEAGRNITAQTRESQTTINCSAIALAAAGSVHRTP
jgi:hypothetical protein